MGCILLGEGLDELLLFWSGGVLAFPMYEKFLCECIPWQETRQHTLFVQNLGGTPAGAVIGGVVECATEPRPSILYVHLLSTFRRRPRWGSPALVLTRGS